MTFTILMATIQVALFVFTDDDDYFITSQIWCAAACAGGAIMDKLDED